MVRKHRVPPWSMKDDRELIEFAAANLDDLAAHFNVRLPSSSREDAAWESTSSLGRIQKRPR
jgi:hypothetical protein